MGTFQFRSVLTKCFVMACTLLLPSTCPAERPTGWGGGGQDHELAKDADVKHGGAASGRIRSTSDSPAGFGALTQFIRADNYRGKRTRLSGFIKADGVEKSCGLWMRVDGADKGGLAFDNMQNRAINGTSDWAKFEIVLDVPQDAEAIYFGALLAGKGKMWIDDLALDTVGNDVASTDLKPPPMPFPAQRRPLDNAHKEPQNPDFEQ